ncbi:MULTISPECIES: hypothetical protein [Halolamina]|uniref:Uncharacterized protein n=1 Tax=Halolamina pelagica TaxID=699431 RepID=A0A1I5WGH6_9EURY|nr:MULTISPECIES: hypothetical protein [Halolamina]NHX37965.1 hypothetical protein [Halolamina sp. R1-12]SFQ18872.1 hypothetical protein SAMN05216277_1307 [Halolamina pelagica]
MSNDDPQRGEGEYTDWERPGQGDDVSAPDIGPDKEEPPPPPSEWRGELIRDHIRERLGVSAQQWYVIETALLVLPYPLFVLIYLTYPVNEMLFLLSTLVYSLIAVYVGFLS